MSSLLQITLLSTYLILNTAKDLYAQCAPGPTVTIPDNTNNPPVINPPTTLQHCVTLPVNPAVTGHPTGITMLLDHDFQGDLSIRINACGGTLMLLTRPSGGNCAGGFPFGSGNDLNGTYTFSDGGGTNPDLGLPLNGGNFGLSGDPCGANNQLNSFAGLASLCGNNPYNIQLCFVDHAGANQGTASQIRLLFPGIVCGCTDPDALNYNAQANTDDGSCLFPDLLGCGATFTDSGGANGNYSNNEYTITRICPDNPTDIVTVTFTAFDVESFFDKLLVFRGLTINSPQIPSGNGAGFGLNCPQTGGYWGTALPGPFVGSVPGECLTFLFCSDFTLTRPGWIANVSCSSPCVPPDPPTASGMTIPTGTAATLTATGCNNGTLLWYDSPNAGTPLASGNTFTTPVLQVSTTYYVACSIDPDCNSPRVPVVVTVQAPPAVPPCGAGNWNVQVYNDINFTAFMGYYTSAGHAADGADDPADAEFNAFKDGIPLSGNPGQALGYTGLPVSNETFAIRASRCGFPCGTVYDLRALNYDDFVQIRIDQDGDGVWEFDYSDGPPAGGTPASLWTGVLGPQSRVELSGYKVGPQHPQYQEPANFELQVQLLNDQTQVALTADAGEDQTSCQSASVIIGGLPTAGNGLGPYNYEWNPTAGLSDNSIANPSASPGNTTTYSVTVSDATGCTASDQVTITTEQCCSAMAGTMTIQPESPCPGEILTVSVSNNQTNSSYAQRFILTDAAGNVLQFRDSGNFTLPMACSNFRVYSYNYLPGPGVVTNPDHIDDINCAAPVCCDLSEALEFSIDGSYSIPPDTASSVDCIQQLTPPSAPDIIYNCGSALMRTGPVIGPDPDCDGVKTFTWTYTDCNGTTFPWVHTVQVAQPVANIPPPSGSTVACISEAIPPTPPMVLDNCGNALTVAGPVIETMPGCTGMRTYAWTYTTCAGDNFTWLYTYQVAPPGITLPPPAMTSVACQQNIIAPSPPVITDACGAIVTPSGPEISQPSACTDAIVYSWTYTDCQNVSYVWTHTFTPTQPQVNMPPPGNATVSCIALAGMPMPPDVTDNCGRQLLRTGPEVDDSFICQGQRIYTWMYSDCAGNSYDWTFTYEIVLPQSVMPPLGNAMVNCLADIIPPSAPIVLDACNNIMAVSGPEISEQGQCPTGLVYTWTYEDCAGRTYLWTYTFVLNDPQIFMPPMEEVLVACQQDAIVPQPPNVVDACGRMLSIDGPSQSGGDGCTEDIVFSWTYTDCTGQSYPWTYRYRFMNRMTDLPAEEIAYISCASDAIEPIPPVIQDNCGDVLTLSGPVVEDIDSCTGQKTYTWTYQDCNGTSFEWRYTYIISGGVVVEFPPDDMMTVNCLEDIFTPDAPDVYDSCGQLLSNSGPVISAPPVCAGTLTYTWNYTDCQGNDYAWTYSFIINEPDITIQCPATVTNCTLASDMYDIPEATALDQCGNQIPMRFSITGTTNRTGNGVDASGNFSPGNSQINWVTEYPCGIQQACVTEVIISPLPDLQISSVICADDLNSYAIFLQSNATSFVFEPQVGNLSGNQVTGIPIGENITITPVSEGCSGIPVTVNAPDCSCPSIPVPVISPSTIILCEGEALPLLQAAVPEGLVINWYTAASGGQLLLAGSDTYQATGPGTFYAEAEDPTTGCRSATRASVTLFINPSPVPIFNAIGPFCSGTPFQLPITSLNGIAGSWMPEPDYSQSGTYTFSPNLQLHPCAQEVNLDIQIDEQPLLEINAIVCSPDLSHYVVQFTLSGGTILSTGGVVNPGEISLIPVGEDISLRASNGTNPSCDVIRFIEAPDCNCPDISPPMVHQAEYTLCAGDAWPVFRAAAVAGQIIYWYLGDSLVQVGGATYESESAGIYYAAAFDTLTGCRSNLLSPISLVVNPIRTPEFEPAGPFCSGISFELPNISGNGIEGTWAPEFDSQQSGQYTFSPDTAQYSCTDTVVMTIDINQQPSVELVSISCAADLQTYMVSIQSSGGDLVSTAGQLFGQQITGIPAGEDIIITSVNPDQPACFVEIIVEAPDCNCPVIPAPTLNYSTLRICAHDTLPDVIAQVDAGMEVDWYSQAFGGQPLLINSLIFTPTLSGIYFAESRDPQTGCVSERRTFQLDILPSLTPVFEPIPPRCAGTPLLLPSESLNGIPGTWTPAVDVNQTTNYTFHPDTALAPCALPANMLVVVDSLPELSVLTASCTPDLEQYQVEVVYSGGFLSATAGTITGSMISGIPAGQPILIRAINPENEACAADLYFEGLDCDCLPIAAPIVQGAEISICQGEAIPAFEALVPEGIMVIWYDAAIGGQVLQTGGSAFTPTQAGDYYAEALDSLTGCRSQTRTVMSLEINSLPLITAIANRTTFCAGEAIQLNASGGISYVWDDGFVGSNRIIQAEENRVIIVRGTDANGCIGSDSLQITVIPRPEAMANPAEICRGDSTLLEASGGAFYMWSSGQSTSSIVVAPTNTTSYTVTVTDEGCSSAVTVEVRVNELPEVDITSSALIICTGQEVSLLASGGVQYLWDNGTEESNLRAQPLVNTRYIVWGSSPEGCTASDSIFIEVVENPSFDFTVSNAGCYGEDAGVISITRVAGGVPPYAYRLNGGPLTQLGQPPAIIGQDLAAGQFSLTLSDQGQCVNSRMVEIPPAAELIVDLGEDRTINLGDTVHITAWVNFDPALIRWSPDRWIDNRDTLELTVMPPYSSAFRVSVYDANGCLAEDEIQIRVRRIMEVYVPSAFSPNGDQINDKFMVYGAPEVKAIKSMSVFNRWGEEVYSVSNFPPNEASYGWDGTFRGKRLNPDVFVWYIVVTYPDGKDELMKGEVILTR
jgi:gliding motility-associated-like protein